MARARIVVACVIWLGIGTIGACGGDDSANPLFFVEAGADSPDGTTSDGTPGGAGDVGVAEARADAPADVDAVDAAGADSPGSAEDADADAPGGAADADAASADAPADVLDAASDADAPDACSSDVCMSCAPSNGTDFYVDPVRGDDASGTGSLTLADSGDGASCAFKTITRALAVVPTPAAPGTRIIVLGPATLGAAETIPITLRTNVVLTTQGGAVTLKIPSTINAQAGVVIAGASAGIQGGAGAPFTIAGLGFSPSTPNTGIVVPLGTNDTTFLENVTVRDFTSAGIYVRGRVTVREGVVSTGAQAIGLTVIGHATIAVPDGHAPASFSANSVLDFSLGAPRYIGRGIIVPASGSVDIKGVPGVDPGTGTVVANGNAETGITFYQLAPGPTPSPSAVDGLVTCDNGARGSQVPLGPSAGVLIYSGANVKLRKSVSLRNYFGVLVVPVLDPIPDGGTSNDDISHVDLGIASTDWGNNTLQALPDAGANLGAGICLELDPGSGTLAAAGNTFAGPRDCSGAAPGAIAADRGGCHAGADVGIFFNPYLPDGGLRDAAAWDSSTTGFVGNDVDVSSCTK